MASDPEASLREKARELLSKGQVGVVVGYGRRAGGEGVRPIFVSKPEDVDNLVWNDRCLYNLATYLTREPCSGIIRKGGRVAVVAKGCDAKAIVGLMQEKQLKRENVFVMGMVCDGVLVEGQGGAEVPSKCLECDAHVPLFADVVVGDKTSVKAKAGDPLEEIKKIENMSDEERWRFWTSTFAKCIKCYACREACPLCYCKECITEKSRPQWIDKSSTPRGNLAYHFIRAMHLAGRCIGCEECRRACPMGIPVDLLSRFLTRKVEEGFGYKPGRDVKDEPFFVTFKDTDPDDFIK